MKLELKKDSILIIPETEQDKAYLTDSIGTNLTTTRVEEVRCGFHMHDEFVLKITKSKENN